MKTFLSVLAIIGLAISSIAQSQGVSQRATNGIAFGEMLVNNHIKATNTLATNTFSGRFQQGQGTVANADGAAAFGLNNKAGGTYSIAGGIGNTTLAAGSLVVGRSNSITSGALNSIVSGNRNSAADFNSFVGGYNNQADGSNTFVFGTAITMSSFTPNNFVIGHNIEVQNLASNNFIWNSDSESNLFVTTPTTNSIIFQAKGGMYLNGVPITSGGGSSAGLKTNQFTTNTIGVPLVGNVNFAGATNNASGDWGVNGVLGVSTANAGTLGVSGNATVNGTLSSSTSTSGVFTVTGSVITTITNAYAYLDSNGVLRGTNNGAGLTNISASSVPSALTNYDSRPSLSLTNGNTFRATNVLDKSNVKFWGAVGDGVGDDTSAFQAALNAVNNSTNTINDPQGKEIFIPAGVYILNTLTLYDGITLRGAGMGLTILRKTSLTNDFLRLTMTNASSQNILGISDLDLIQVGSAVSGAAIRVVNSNSATCRLTLKNLQIRGTFYGVQTENLLLGVFENIRVSYVVSHGFYLWRSMNAMNFTSCYAVRCGGDGWIISGDDNTFTSCASDENAGSGFLCDTVRGSSFTGITTEKCGRDGFTLSNCVSVVVQSVILSTNGSRDGIRIDGGSDISVNNCWVDGQYGVATGYNICLTNLSGNFPSQVTLIGNKFDQPYPLGAIADSKYIITRLSGPTNQTTVGTNFGVGLPDPKAPVHIKVTAAVSSSGTEALRIENINTGGIIGDGSIINFNSPFITEGQIRSRTETLTPEFGLSFSVYSSGLNEAVRIRYNGNVGIGTTSPGAKLEVAGTALIRTNIAQFDVTTSNFVLGTRYTNSTRRAFVAASFQLAAAVAGTAAVTMNVEQAGVTNNLTVSSGPLAGLTTIEPLALPVGPGAFYYFTDATSGAGAAATIVAGTSSLTAW